MSIYLTVYCTYKDAEQAERISRELLDSRLVACANILPAGQSMYWWKDEIVKESEVYVLYKTTTDQFPKVEAMIKDMHSYDVPCIVAWSIKDGHLPYLRWISAETP